MGKTKISVTPENTKKSKLSYEEKRALRDAQKNAEVASSEPASNQSSLKSPIKIQRTEEAKETKESSESKVSSVSRGKKYQASQAKVEDGKTYPLSEAAKLVKETSYSKFDGRVELHLIVDKDSVNQMVELPYSTGATRKVEIVSDETIEKLKAGKIDFDVLIAKPSDMTKLVPFAKLLGPRGLMPNPKNGTLVDSPEKAVSKFGGNNIQLKTEKSAPLIHTAVAKVSMNEKEIQENVAKVLESIGKKSIKKAVISATMGPGIELQVA